MSEPRPNYGITRIDQPEKKNHGFYVRITHRGKGFQKYFPDKSLGGKPKALKAANAYRDSLLEKMPRYKQESAAKKKRKIKQSGVPSTNTGRPLGSTARETVAPRSSPSPATVTRKRWTSPKKPVVTD